jgi:hypothetical protein
MSDSNTIEWLVAKLSRLEKQMSERKDDRMDAFTSLMSSLESSLAELLAGIENGGGAASIERAAEALKSISPDITFSPNINVAPTPIKVNVNPTPITVEAVMPQQLAPVLNFESNQKVGSTWEARIPSSFGGPDRVMTIKRTG